MKRAHVFVILDRSGSMKEHREDHLSGLRSLIEEQKTANPEPLFTLIQFNSANPFELIYDAVPITSVGDISLEPHGMSPISDTLGKTIMHARTRLTEDESPIFVVITDGPDQFSVEWKKEMVRSHINERCDAGWRFLFFGAGIDALAEANTIGLPPEKAANVSLNSTSILSMYSVVSNKLKMYNCQPDACLEFSDGERLAMMSA